MRISAILACLACGLLTSCSGGPGALGITGPGIRTVPPPETAEDTQAGSPATGTSYGSAYGAAQGPTGFWGYNQ